MTDALGLSLGMTNVSAARPGLAPVIRRAVLTLWDDRPAEIGVPSQNPELTSPNLAQAGLVMRGFVERVGDPVPLVGADGSAHRGEILATAALEAMARTVDNGFLPNTVVVAVPAHWPPGTVAALRAALRTSPVLCPGGVAPTIVSDATAALTALRQQPTLPSRGVVAVCDFGGTGSTITLCDLNGVATSPAPIGDPVRVADFSGDRIDQILLNHVLAGARAAGHIDPDGTAAVGSLARLRGECRLAKERLSADTATTLNVELPGYRADIRVTRAELEELIAESFGGFLDALADTLESNRIPAASLTAVATVGGGAAIPLITQRLSGDLRVPVVTDLAPGTAAAVGAALLGSQTIAPDAPTGLAPSVADAPTGLAPAGWAGRAPDDSPSATHRALAWSEDDEGVGDPVPYVGDDYSSAATPQPGYPPAAPTGARPAVDFGHGPDYTDTGSGPVPLVLPWYRRPALLFGIAAALAASAVGGLALTLTNSDSSPTTTTTRVTKPGETPAPVPQTITVTGGNGQTTITTVTPPPPTTTVPTSEATATTTSPTTTTTTPTTTTTTPTTPTTPTTTTTTTPTTTTTTTTTTAPTTTRTTTTPPTTTVAPPPTTTAAPPPTTTVAPPPTTTAAPQPTTLAPQPTTAAPDTQTPAHKPASSG